MVNIIIDRTIQPKLMSDAIGVSELFVMFAAFAGGEVAGIWGMLLGIPVAAMGKALFEWFHLNFLTTDEPDNAGLLIADSSEASTDPTTEDGESVIARESSSDELDSSESSDSTSESQA